MKSQAYTTLLARLLIYFEDPTSWSHVRCERKGDVKDKFKIYHLSNCRWTILFLDFYKCKMGNFVGNQEVSFEHESTNWKIINSFPKFSNFEFIFAAIYCLYLLPYFSLNLFVPRTQSPLTTFTTFAIYYYVTPYSSHVEIIVREGSLSSFPS